MWHPYFYSVNTRKCFVEGFFGVWGKIELESLLLCDKSVLEMYISDSAVPHYAQITIFLCL